jgi:Xaa-Pro aminopeptidase
MITAEGCRNRVARLLSALKPAGPLLLADPTHLRYFANAYVDPFHLGTDYGPMLAIRPDGSTTLIFDSRAPTSLEQAFITDRVKTKWYDGQSAGKGSRRMIIRQALEDVGTAGRVHDDILDPDAQRLHDIVSNLRRRKDPDEIEQLKLCMRVTEIGHAWARANVKPGMTEVDVYTGIQRACTLAAGQSVIVYGDFAVSPGTARRGGPPKKQIINAGDMLILDYSVVIQGYRSDFTNTLVVGIEPNAAQKQLYDQCVAAMKAGEIVLRAGVSCQKVFDAVNSALAVAGGLVHHAGHGLGLTHPEAPFFVTHSEGEVVAGDVVTLEPGLYIDGIGGIRIEHNYLVTNGGYERLSNHTIALK